LTRDLENSSMPTWTASKRPHSARSTASSAADWCLSIVDWGIAAIVLVAPFFFGGRHLLGRFVFIALTCIVSIAWLTHQAMKRDARWTPTFAHALGLAAIGLVALQLVPLPAEWINWLSPRNQTLLPLWNSSTNSSVAFGDWPSLSLAPQNTKLALATLIAYYLLFVTASQRLRNLSDIQLLLKLVALSALLMGCFGLLQYLTSNGRFFWFYEYPFTSTNFPVKGSFTCRNHFAHFLTLGIGPLVASIVLAKTNKSSKSTWSSQPSKSNPLLTFRNALCIGCIVLAVGVLMTLSRGGAMAAVTAAVVVVALYLRQGLLTGGHLYGIAVMGLVVVGLLSVGNYDIFSSRLEDFKSGSVEELDSHSGRRRIWNANYEAIKQGGLFGAGAGSHREIYPAYLQESFRKEYTHAENSYLQIVTENGWLGLGLMGSTVFCVLTWCWRAVRVAGDKQQAALAGAVVASLIASLVHAAVDFVWFIPACLSLALLLAACALRLAQLGTTNPQRHIETSPVWQRSRWIALATIAVLASTYAVTVAIKPAAASLSWDKYLLAASKNSEANHQQLKELKTDTEQSDAQHMINEMLILQLEDTVLRDPQFARASARLATQYLKLFESNQRVSPNAMPIEQIRGAVIASKFDSSRSLKAWLTTALGKNSVNLYRAHYYARRAVQLCPLQGEAYLILAKLCFLEGKGNAGVDAYVQQGLRLRPKNGSVLFDSGWQYLHLGETNRAIKLWQAVYQQPEPRRLQIIQHLASGVSAPMFIALFQPDWHTLPYIWKRYREIGTPEDWQALLAHGLIAAQQEQSDHSGFGAARIWLKLSNMHTEIGDLPQSLACLASAYQLAPDDYSVRRALGRTLLNAGRLAEAQPHLRWCLSRNPENPRLRGELVKATKQTYRPQMARSPNSTSTIE